MNVISTKKHKLSIPGTNVVLGHNSNLRRTKCRLVRINAAEPWFKMLTPVISFLYFLVRSPPAHSGTHRALKAVGEVDTPEVRMRVGHTGRGGALCPLSFITGRPLWNEAGVSHRSCEKHKSLINLNQNWQLLKPMLHKSVCHCPSRFTRVCLTRSVVAFV